MKPRIDLVSPPFAGHLHPLLGIGRALRPVADVRVLSTESAMQRVSAAELVGEVLCPGLDPALRAIADTPYRVGANPFLLHRQFRGALGVFARVRAALVERYRARAERPALVLADFTVPAAGSAARAHGIPWWTSHPSPPVIEGGGGPPPYFGWKPGRGPLGRTRDRIGFTAQRTFKRAVHRLNRRALTSLGFPGVYRDDGSEAAYSPERILALGLRELEFPRTWPASVRFVGPVLWSPPGRGSPPPGPGARPAVLATFGTHVAHAKARLVGLLERAARAHPRIELHYSGGNLEGTTAEGDGVLCRHAWVDYPTWIPRMRAVLHHGGSGITWECLRAGVPMLVLPLDFDNFDNAARLEAARVALRLGDRQELAPALERVLEERSGLQPRRFVELLRPGRAEGLILSEVRARLGC